MQFSAIKQGTRARERAELPLNGAKLDEATGKWIGDVVAVDLRPLLPEEIADVHRRASAYAKEKGVEPKEGEPAFDIAVAVFTVHAAALDTEGDGAFFDVPAEALFRSEGLSLDAIVYLFERQQLWQAKSSPRPGFITPEELEAQIERMGGGGDAATFFFARLQPAARLICMHTMAGLLASSRKPRSGPGTASASATTPPSASTRSATGKSSSGTSRKRGRR